MAAPSYIRILPHLTGPYGGPVIERFWEKVARGGEDECWDWTASLHTSGYGRFKMTPFTSVSANRVALALHTGIEPPGLQALHSCDRPICCNPKHLRWGTVADNAQDKVQRGRAKTGDQSGDRNGAAKITRGDLEVIINGFRRGLNNKEIARALPIGHAMVSKIRRGHMWRDQARELGWIGAPESRRLPHERIGVR